MIFIGSTDSHSTDVGLTWYDNGTAMSGGPSSCTVGGTFVPPTPPARPGYIFAGWKAHSAGGCGIWRLTSMAGTAYGYTSHDASLEENKSNYGLTLFGQWAVEFDHGTVWGMAKCSNTYGNNSSYTWPESSKSNWLKNPSNTKGQYCWCQATGFTASGNSYTSGPQCTTTASSLWVFYVNDYSSNFCVHDCAYYCAYYVQTNAAFRAAVFGSVGQ